MEGLCQAVLRIQPVFLSFFLFLDRKESFWDPNKARHSDSPVLHAEQNKTGFLRTQEAAE